MKQTATSKPSRSTGAKMDRLMTAWANNEGKIYIAALVAVMILSMLVTKRYVLSIMVNCCVYGVLALSLNILTGLMGVTTLGHAAFFGFGAYTAAILATRFGCNMLITFLAAMAVTAVLATLIGIPAANAPTQHLAIITLGFCEIARIVELNWLDLTGGPLGISAIPSFKLFGFSMNSMRSHFYIGLVLLVIVFFISKCIENSRTGRALAAIRYDAVAAEAMGVDIRRYKLLYFVLSAALAGLAGAFYAHHAGFVDPKSFTFDQSILIVSMVILGGMGNLTGSVIGAILLCVIPELLRGTADYRQVIYGLVIVFVVVFRPSGMLGKYNFRYLRQRSKLAKEMEEGRE